MKKIILLTLLFGLLATYSYAWDTEDYCMDEYCIEFKQAPFGPGYVGEAYLTWEEEGVNFTKYYSSPLGRVYRPTDNSPIYFDDLGMTGFFDKGILFIATDVLEFK